MRVLLIYPSIDCPPGINHGLAAMSGVLRSRGHETRLVHACENLWPLPETEEIKEIVRSYKPGIIGFSAMSQQFDWCCDVSRALKTEFPEIPHCVGGVHCTMVPEEVTDTKVFDYVCVGEGEYAFLELVERLERGEDTFGVPNMRIPRADGQPIVNPVGPFPDLGTLPPKDYELFDLDHIIRVKKGWMGMITSRGCPYKCTYCFNKEIIDRYLDDGGAKKTKDYLRHYSVERMLGEIRMLIGKYPALNTFIFDDDLFTLNKAYVKEFCRAYTDAKIGIPFVVNAHVQKFDEEMAEMLKEAGCMIVKFGLESGSARIRKEVLWRYMTNERIVQSFHAAHKFGLHTSAFIMFGLPFEGRADIEETLRLCAETKMGRFRWALFFPFPGTAGYTIAKKANLIDYEKMKAMGNYFDGSCLNFDDEHNFYLEKLSKLCIWWVNAYSDWPCASEYERLVKDVEKMDRTAWDREREGLVAYDERLSEELLERGVPHYSIRYTHVMGVHSDFVRWDRERLAGETEGHAIDYTLD